MSGVLHLSRSLFSTTRHEIPPLRFPPPSISEPLARRHYDVDQSPWYRSLLSSLRAFVSTSLFSAAIVANLLRARMFNRRRSHHVGSSPSVMERLDTNRSALTQPGLALTVLSAPCTCPLESPTQGSSLRENSGSGESRHVVHLEQEMMTIRSQRVADPSSPLV